MARPKAYDDTWLLQTMAELIVAGEAKTRAEAQRKAVSFIVGSDSWPDHRRQQAYGRLKKAYTSRGAELERDASERIRKRRESMPWLPRFLPPTLLTAPLDPQQTRQAH